MSSRLNVKETGLLPAAQNYGIFLILFIHAHPDLFALLSLNPDEHR